jgi:ABC-2 type transport system permease protein
MKKYFTVFAIDWQNQFTYRLNFLLWRARNIARIILTFFLWQAAFFSTATVFGYTSSDIFVYFFFVLIFQSFILSLPSGDNVGGEISTGNLSNYLVKPINYSSFWFVRDLSSKILNLLFSLIEVTVLYLVVRPQLPQIGVLNLAVSMLLALTAIGIYYFLRSATSFVAFWAPENTWGISFLALVFVETLSGMIFPLDIFPSFLRSLLQLTPFPYLIYYPSAVLLGRFHFLELWPIVFNSFAWLGLTYLLNKFVWKKGLRIYSSEGK